MKFEVVVVGVQFFILCFILAFWGLVISAICCGNYWFSEEKALRIIQIDAPSIIKIITVNRNVWAYSEIKTEDFDGTRKTFLINTDVLQNASVEK